MKSIIAITLLAPLVLLASTHPPVKKFSSYVLYEISSFVEPNITSCERCQSLGINGSMNINIATFLQVMKFLEDARSLIQRGYYQEALEILDDRLKPSKRFPPRG